MRRRHAAATAAAALAAMVLTLPTVARAQTPICGPSTCADNPPAGFLVTGNAEVPGDLGGFTWTRPLPNGNISVSHQDAFFPIEPTHTLPVVQGEVLRLRFDPSLAVTDLVVRRGTTSDAPLSALHVVSTSVGNPTQFTTDFRPGTWYLSVFADFAQGNVSYFFKLDVRPPEATPAPPVAVPPVPVAAPATPVARHPNFTG